MTAGESHGPALVAILEGLPAGLPVSQKLINLELHRRQQGFGAGSRMKIEQDRARILSGVMEGVTIGSPLSILIENRDHQNWRGKPIAPLTIPRPGHADFTGAIKYEYSDLRPALERASARETAARVAVGAICKQLLASFKIQVGAYVVSIDGVIADVENIPISDRLILAENSKVRCPDPSTSRKMVSSIRKAMKEGETLGGIIEIITLGLPPGLGSYVHWDRRLDAKLGAAVLSVQAIKGVEFGQAFINASIPGSSGQDSIYLVGEDLVRKTNRSGGLEGGITTGSPLLIRAAMKPIATTITPQHTVDLAQGREVLTHYERSDFCPVPRAVPVLESMVAFVLADALLEKLGGDSMQEALSRFDLLRTARISDFSLDKREHIFWPDVD